MKYLFRECEGNNGIAGQRKLRAELLQVGTQLIHQSPKDIASFIEDILVLIRQDPEFIDNNERQNEMLVCLCDLKEEGSTLTSGQFR